MFCFKCGHAMADDARICPSCGAPAPVAAVLPPPVPSNAPATTAWQAAAPPQSVAALPQTEDKAVISMVLGILGLVSFSILTGIPAIILGRMSRENIRASRGRLTGEGMATAGIVMGWVSVGIAALIAVVVIIIIIIAALAASRH